MDKLFEYSNKLIADTEIDFVRYMFDSINWDSNLIGLIGPRGIGKTTLILQYIKLKLPLSQTLYVTAEDFYFARHRILDLANEFVSLGGKHLFIDEIHKYPDWSKELKLIYDYHPDLNLVFTGSSILDIKKGSADLSRRAVIHSMQGLSFREYLKMYHQIETPVYSLEEILNHQVKSEEIPDVLNLFSDYLKNGYYPFAKEGDYHIRLQQVINQTLETDIPVFSGMHVATGRKLKQLLAIVAESVPFKPNMSKIAEILNISRNNIADYLLYIEEAGMIAQLRTDIGGIRSLGKIEKIYLDNTNLIYTLAKENMNTGNLRETFFFNQLKLDHDIVSSSRTDFKIGELEFEIGGKTKKSKQILDFPKGYLVKDDIITGFLNRIPLWHFGLMY